LYNKNKTIFTILDYVQRIVFANIYKTLWDPPVSGSHQNAPLKYANRSENLGSRRFGMWRQFFPSELFNFRPNYRETMTGATTPGY
jgi:hypothetical protein